MIPENFSNIMGLVEMPNMISKSQVIDFCHKFMNYNDTSKFWSILIVFALLFMRAEKIFDWMFEKQMLHINSIEQLNILKRTSRFCYFTFLYFFLFAVWILPMFQK